MDMEKRYIQHALRLLEQYDESHHRIWKELWKNLQRYQSVIPESAVHLWEADGIYGDEDCDDCAYVDDLCRLVHSLVRDIIHLEEEVVRWRQALVKYLPKQWAQGLQSDIFDNLAARHGGDPAYEAYLRHLGLKQDPMETQEHTEKMCRLRDGIDETTVFF